MRRRSRGRSYSCSGGGRGCRRGSSLWWSPASCRFFFGRGPPLLLECERRVDAVDWFRRRASDHAVVVGGSGTSPVKAAVTMVGSSPVPTTVWAHGTSVAVRRTCPVLESTFADRVAVRGDAAFDRRRMVERPPSSRSHDRPERITSTSPWSVWPVSLGLASDLTDYRVAGGQRQENTHYPSSSEL